MGGSVPELEAPVHSLDIWDNVVSIREGSEEVLEEEESQVLRDSCPWNTYLQGESCGGDLVKEIIDDLLISPYFWVSAVVISGLLLTVYILLSRALWSQFHTRKVFMDAFHTMWFLITSFVLSWWQFPMQPGSYKHWNNGYLLVFFAPIVLFVTGVILEILNPMTNCCVGDCSFDDYLSSCIIWKYHSKGDPNVNKRNKYQKKKILLLLWWLFETAIHIAVLGVMGVFAMGFQSRYYDAKTACIVGWIGFWGGMFSLCVTFVVYLIEICLAAITMSRMMPDKLLLNGTGGPNRQSVVVPGTGMCCFKAKTNNIDDYNKCVRCCIKELMTTNSINSMNNLIAIDMNKKPINSIEDTKMFNQDTGSGSLVSSQVTIFSIMRDMKADKNLNSLEDT